MLTIIEPFTSKKRVNFFGSMATAAALALMAPLSAAAAGANGTTLAAYKTLDICTVNDNTWRYSGVVSVWNEGVIDTQNFTLRDYIEVKAGTKWSRFLPGPAPASWNLNTLNKEIPAGTTQATALTFPYSEDGPKPLVTGAVRNTAELTITNHSAHLGKPYGPTTRATYSGSFPPPPCDKPAGQCTYTQGYWGNKPGVVWPTPYNRNASFFVSGQTWQQVLDTSVNVSQGYYQLAHQYIAAVLNQANGAAVPQGVQDTLNLATPWLSANNPAACTAKGSCGVQKDWAATLDLYNNGIYPGGPSHCGDDLQQ